MTETTLGSTIVSLNKQIVLVTAALPFLKVQAGDIVEFVWNGVEVVLRKQK